MNAANDLAKKGHLVTLVEKKKILGGQMNIAIVPKHKTKDLKPFVDYLKLQLEINGVKIKTNKEVTIENVNDFKPDIINCTGHWCTA
jgi:NADPH-dependent glutamate synthase beta subunit-like oxidoreductase